MTTTKPKSSSKTPPSSAQTKSKPQTATTKKNQTKANKTVAFQAEVRQILDLVIHSLYSQKEIFLRELISNAHDAIEKRRLAGLENPELTYDGTPEIWIHPDKKSRTLTITDTGIGMSPEEVEQNIGTIAHSGTKEFTKKLGKIKENPDLIGQFGVGFYSSFMVADKVELHTQKVGTNTGTHWESTGDGTYTLSAKPRKDGAGTSVTLHLKVFADEEENADDFTDTWQLKTIVKKYSDFLDVPIKTMVEKTEPVKDDTGDEDANGDDSGDTGDKKNEVSKNKDGQTKPAKTITKLEEETLNSMKALWRKPASSIKADEYSEFYKNVCKDWSDPLETIHYKAEGSKEFVALLFIPSQVPFDYYHRDRTWGPSLYINKVFISDNVTDLLPNYLRFIKGVVDSDDIPLNVSREILQKDHQLKSLSTALQFKILKHLEKLLTKNRDHYEKFWGLWGNTLKEGIATDFSQKSKLEKLCLFRTTIDNRWTTLAEYVSRMKPNQKAIYYLTGESRDQIKDSPHMEKIKQHAYEVLLLVDQVDEWVSQSLREFEGKDIISLSGHDLKLNDDTTDEQKEEAKKKQDELDKEFNELKACILKALPDELKEVKISTRLVDSPVCLVSDAHDPSARMEKIMGTLGQSIPKVKRILEINPDHPIIQKMATLTESKQQSWAYILYQQSLLNEGSPIENPVSYTRKINEIMTELAQK